LSLLDALWLGIVQGLTEFFPVSSSGHLVMLQTLLGIEEEGGIVFEIAVHVATMVAIVIFYRARIWRLITGVLTRRSEDLVYVAKLAIGTVPAVVVGLVAKDWISEQFSNPRLVGVALLATGAILWTLRWTTPRANSTDPSFKVALLVGCAQAFAILPGISRSGSTVAMAVGLGMATGAAAEFSFLLGIIAIAGAAVLMLPELTSTSPSLLGSVAVGSVAALVSGIAALRLFVRMLEQQQLHLFAVYAWAVGALFLLGLWIVG